MSAEAAVKLTLHDRITEGIKRIEARFDRMAKRLNFDRISRSAQRFGKSLSGIGAGLTRTTQRLGMMTGVLGLGGGGLIAGLWRTVKGLANLGGELDAMSRRAGVGAEALQELAFAGKTRGVSFDAMVDGLKELNLRADEFIATGKGTGAEAFARLGYSASALREKLKDPAALFEEIVDRLSKFDQSTQIRFTDELFGGTAGEQFQQMVGLTAKQIRELRNEARATGNVIGNDVVEASRKFLANWSLLTMRLEGFRNLLGAHLLPGINDAVLRITQWADANRDLIKSKLEDWAKRITKVVKDLLDPSSELRQRIDNIVRSIIAFGDFLKPVTDRIGGLTLALTVIGAYIAAPLVTALSLATLAFLKLGTAMLFTPLGPILAGLTALGAIGYVLYQRWDDFAQFWKDMWNRIAGAFKQNVINGFIQVALELDPRRLLWHMLRGLDEVQAYFTGFSLFDAGERIVNSLLEGLKATWADLGRWMKDSISDLFGWLPKSIQSRLGFDVEVAPNMGNLAKAVGSVGNISLPELSAVPKNAASDPRVAAVKALSQEPVNTSSVSNVDNSRTVRIDSLTVNAPPGADARQIAAAVRRELEQEERAERLSALNN